LKENNQNKHLKSKKSTKMKRIVITFLAVITSVVLFAQAPNAFNYQGVARDLTGSPIVNKNIGLRISIIQGTISETEVYKELHLVSTNNTGLFNIQIGYGTPVNDSIEMINWRNGPFYLKIEIDTEGGSNYQLVGTNQLLSVPYALYAENSGDHVKLLPPTVVTNNASNLSLINVTLNGIVNGNGFMTDGIFEYDTTMQLANTIKVIQNPVVGSKNIPVSANLTDLIPNKTYYFRIKGTNAVGISTGDIMSFILVVNIPDEPVTDVDGNEYQTVKIGDQIWMAENLKTTKYRDSTSIPLITDGTEWANHPSGAYCYFGNNADNVNIYGNLYNWYTVVDEHKLCPSGWHVPTINEVNKLINYLGGPEIAGGKLKETGTVHWVEPNEGATNESGFTALPSGDRNYFGNFGGMLGKTTAFWTTQDLNSYGGVFILYFDNTKVEKRGWGKRTGLPVRCIKD
jgi:uncharacterized protein (TIGR02145 family)